MNFNGFLLYRQLCCQKLADFDTLISLKLDDFAHFYILDQSSIARKVFLQGLEYSLLIKFAWHTLYSGQCLPSVSLLNPDIYRNSVYVQKGHMMRTNIVLRLCLIIAGVFERI